MDAYKKTLDILCPVAIKTNQNEIDAPGHNTWINTDNNRPRRAADLGLAFNLTELR
jgi:hypothetical protein